MQNNPQPDDKIVLHGMSSPNVTKVLLMLEECGLDYHFNHMNVFGGDQFDPAFLALSPLGKVPALEDPALGKPLVESGAILWWLAEREGRFLPGVDQPVSRAEVIEWLMIQMANIGPMLGQLNHFGIVPPDREDYSRARYRAIAEKLYRVLNERLTDREWIAGGAYSIADMAIYPWSDYLERHGFDPAIHPALVAWRQRIAARPAVQRVIQRVARLVEESTDSVRNAKAEDLDRFFSRTETVPAMDFSAVTRL